jgi:hypothetical protein
MSYYNFTWSFAMTTKRSKIFTLSDFPKFDTSHCTYTLKAKGTPQKNDINVFTKDLQDAKRSNSETKAKIAIQEFKKWKRS